ncbi:hypothetical protein [Azospirillum argentinense]
MLRVTFGTLFAIINLFLITNNGVQAAASSDGSYYAFGPGAESCGTFLSAREAEVSVRKAQGRGEENGFATARYGHYLGYVSGWNTMVNVTTPGVENLFQGTDIGGVMVWLENYCRQHPLDQFAMALSALWTEQAKRQQNRRPQ